ncbi:MAG: hypothetical protein ACRECE_13305, partial [Xanthobacteraceae bacterium]
AVAAAIAVDDFSPEELTARGAAQEGDVSSQATPRSLLQLSSDQAAEMARLAGHQAPQAPQPTTEAAE